MSNKLINPYTVDGDVNTLVLQSNIGVADYQYIKGLILRQGALDRTAATLWKKLCQRCREAGFTDFTSEQKFIDYVNNLELPPVNAPTTTSADDKSKRSRRSTKGPVPEVAN